MTVVPRFGLTISCPIPFRVAIRVMASLKLMIFMMDALGVRRRKLPIVIAVPSDGELVALGNVGRLIILRGRTRVLEATIVIRLWAAVVMTSKRVLRVMCPDLVRGVVVEVASVVTLAMDISIRYRLLGTLRLRSRIVGLVELSRIACCGALNELVILVSLELRASPRILLSVSILLRSATAVSRLLCLVLSLTWENPANW